MAAPPPVLTLAVEKGPRAGEARQCRAGAALRVGRVISGNDLAVRDVGASQRHLAVEFLPPPAARWAVSDLGSSNGTFLNGARLAPSVPAPLSDGDLIALGESTKLAVSIAPDSEAKPAPRRSSRRAAPMAKVVEEKPTPSVIRRSTRKKAGVAAERSEAEKEVVVEEEKPQVVTRRSRRNKAAAPQALEAGKEEIEEAAVETRRARKKKAVEPPEPAKAEEKAEVATRRTRRKNADPSESEKGEEGNDAVAVAPPPVPRTTRSRRGRGRVTAPCAMETVPEEEEEREEVVAPAEEKGDKVAAGGEVEGTAKALEVMPVAPRGRARRAPKAMTNARCAASDNVDKEVKGGGEEEEDGKREAIVSGGKVGDVENAEEPARRSSLEIMPVAPRGRARRVPKGMTNAQCASSDNVGKDTNGAGEKEDDGKMEAVGNGGDVEDVENTEELAGRSILETMPVAGREQAQRAPKGMTNAQCASSDNVDKEINGAGEEEDDSKREAVVNGGKVGDVENAEECAGRSSLEIMPVAGREQAQRAPKGMTNARCAASDNNRGEEINDGGEEEQGDKKEAAGNGGDVENVEKAEKRAGRSSLETMTLGEWFDRMEKYLPRTINEAADEMIATMEEKHRRIIEYISTIGNSSNPS
ncbi:hypothetical protein QYE76_030214 [Lolium multiflorum]|uniref:FHA domain-containing protein n=1 Tax=Lolium multiflorum TaxID=4521 RepID=A0AAD8QPC4_LOLMU|nr:hypothetical protein QYE76_030214 [Lolium multiflorum]